MEKFSLLTKLAKCTLNIALKPTKMSPVFHPDDSRGKRRELLFSSFYCHLQGEKLSLKKRYYIKQCLGGLKCSQNTKENKKTLKVSFKAIFKSLGFVCSPSCFSLPAACRLFSRGVIFTRALLSLRKMGDYS